MQIVKKLAALLILSFSAYAGAGLDSAGTMDAAAHRVHSLADEQNALSGLVLATPYVPGQPPSDYFAATPAKVKPVTAAAVGERLALLTVISNPLADAKGFVNVQCNIKATRPDGAISLQQHGIDCLQGKRVAGSGASYLSPMVIKFTGESGDPLGRWLFEVEAHDINRNTRQRFSAQFELTGKADLAHVER